jgi:hypothetical protein
MVSGRALAEVRVPRLMATPPVGATGTGRPVPARDLPGGELDAAGAGGYDLLPDLVFAPQRVVGTEWEFCKEDDDESGRYRGQTRLSR